MLSGKRTVEGKGKGKGEKGEVPYPVSQSLDAGVPRGAYVPTPAPRSTPTPAPLVSPASTQASGCTLVTRTLAPAPDGSSDERREVGVNEIVEMELKQSSSVTWTASSGTISTLSPTTANWTAPVVGTTSPVTATSASGVSCSVSMKVLPPTSRTLVKFKDPSYPAGEAGSGFLAYITFNPTKVSFSQTEFREEEATGVATGWYNLVDLNGRVGLNGIIHKKSKFPVVPDPVIFHPAVDEVGQPQGYGLPNDPPFLPGTFHWDIPQTFRKMGSIDSWSTFSKSRQLQFMGTRFGIETTSKEGAKRTRIPKL